jgi:Cytochrome P460
MKIFTLIVLSLWMPLAGGQDKAIKPKPPIPTGRDATVEPAYDAEGKLQPPFQYREWIYLTSGIDMSYNPKSELAGRSTFDNVFVNPAAYRAFKETGTWPDKTMMVLEQRGAEGPTSINHRGHSQGGEITGFEVHVRDEAKTPGGWAFYEFDNAKPAEQIPVAAACYSCHEQHAAVATTFVQFYPTLLPIAKRKKTLSAAYLKEFAAEPKP